MINTMFPASTKRNCKGTSPNKRQKANNSEPRIPEYSKNVRYLTIESMILLDLSAFSSLTCIRDLGSQPAIITSYRSSPDRGMLLHLPLWRMWSSVRPFEASSTSKSPLNWASRRICALGLQRAKISPLPCKRATRPFKGLCVLWTVSGRLRFRRSVRRDSSLLTVPKHQPFH
jgi:hypothetical protein